MNPLFRSAIWGCVAILLLAFTVHFAAPPIARALLVKVAGEKLGRAVTVREVVIHPFSLSVAVRGFELKERDGENTAASFDELFADLEAAPLLRGTLALKDLRLTSPRLKVVHLDAHRYNFSDVIETLLKQPDDKSPPHFTLNNVVLREGNIDFEDRPQRKRHIVSDIHLAIPFLSSLAGDSATLVQPWFEAKVDGHPLKIKGQARPYAEKLEATLDLAASDIDLASYFGYLPEKPPYVLTKGLLDTNLTLAFSRRPGKQLELKLSGRLALKHAQLSDAANEPLLALDALELRLDSVTPLSATQHAGGSIALNGLTLARQKPGLLPFEVVGGNLDASSRFSFEFADKHPQLILEQLALSLAGVNLRLTGEKKPFFTLETLTLGDARLDLAQRQLVIGSIATSNGRLALKRAPDGTLDLARLSLPQPSVPQAESAPWRVSLNQIKLEGYGVRFEDGAFVLNAAPLALKLDNYSTEPNSKITLSLSTGLNGKGKFSADGELLPSVPLANLKLVLDGLDLAFLQPYIAEHFNLGLKQGALSAKGSLDVASTESDGAIKASFRGEATLANLHAVDLPGESDLLKWKSLYLGGMRADNAPAAFAVDEIALSDFYSRLIINPDGKLNLQQLARAPKDDGSLAAKTASGASTPLTIGKVTLQGGMIQFSDRYIKPTYSARLTDIGGRVAGLSPEGHAEIELRGRLDNSAPLQIDGKINPFGANLYADIKTVVKGIDLTPFSPYAGKYAGYAIEKGKLSLDVRYHVENRKLEAENNLFLDQLTFGARVDSMDATTLPVQLAVALLKNGKGEIDIRLPIGGSLDDPQFNLGEVIGKVLGNLLWKTVSAPFAFLANLFGGDGEALGWLEFEPGRNTIPAAGADKLKSLAQALAQKSGLNLEVAGRADPATDREGLKQVRLERKLKTLKRDDLAKQGITPPPLEDMALTPEEYPDLLERVYAKEDFPKPRDLHGLTKALPAAEMEKLILAHSTVSDENLLSLANRRARAARDWLLEKGAIPGERIFLVAPKLAPVGEEDPKKALPSRVEFSLK